MGGASVPGAWLSGPAGHNGGRSIFLIKCPLMINYVISYQ